MPQPLDELFDRITGGRLPDLLPGELGLSLQPFRSCFDIFRRELRNQIESVGDIYFNIVDERALNAIAFTEGAQEFVGINAGLAVVLPIYYVSVLSHPAACPEIGDADAEEPTGRIEKDLLFLSGRARDLRLGVNWNPRLDAPRDQRRLHYATYLCKLAFDFLLNHEVGHIVRHIPFLSRTAFPTARASSMNVLIEFESGLSKEECAVRRVLEADADGVAARCQIGSHEHNTPERVARAALGLAGPGTAWNWTDVCRAWLRAVWLLFQVMAVLDQSPVEMSARTHPHPDVRMDAILNTAWAKWKAFVSDIQTYRALVVSVMREMEILSESVLPPLPVRHVVSHANDISREAGQIWTQLQDLGPSLNELTEQRRIGRHTRK